MYKRIFVAVDGSSTTHGRRGLDRLPLGSVAEGVSRTAPVSVLLVRGTGSEEQK